MKLKNFSYLKYISNATTQETPQPTKHKIGFQKPYASAGTNNSNVSISHKSKNINVEKESQTFLIKLKTLKSKKRPQRRERSPDRNTSRLR